MFVLPITATTAFVLHLAILLFQINQQVKDSKCLNIFLHFLLSLNKAFSQVLALT